MTALALLTTLTFTAPTLNADSTPCTDLARVIVWRQRQSPTWVAKHDSMEASPLVWSRYWPTVKWEAEPVVCAIVPARAALACTVSVAGTGWFWSVVAQDSAGNVSGKGNQVFK